MGSPETRPGEVEELKQRIVELQRRATVAEIEGARLKRELVRLEAELEESKQAGAEPEGALNEAAPMTSSAIGLDQEIEESDLEEPPVVAALAVADGPATPELETSVIEPATAIPSAQAQALYDDGYSLFHQMRYADAEERFSRYVELHPRTDLADNALFWIGESRYARGDFGSALEAFSDTVERYPQGNKVSDALLKAGRCLESLGDNAQARGTYEEVVRRYPSSAAAAQARDRLDELR